MEVIRSLLRRSQVRCDQSNAKQSAATVVTTTLDHQFPPDFSPSLINLFERIQRRGTEPLVRLPLDNVPVETDDVEFPASWASDFLGLPPVLFRSELADSHYPLLSSIAKGGTDAFRAKFAFERLLLLGQEVRRRMDSISRHEDQISWFLCELVVKEGLRRYLTWAARDAGINLVYMPLFLVLCSSGRRTNCSDSLRGYKRSSEKLISKLRRLSRAHRDSAQQIASLNSLTRSRSQFTMEKSLLQGVEVETFSFNTSRSSTIYGFCLAGYKLTIVALNTTEEQFPIRTLLTVDYSDPGQDLWSTIAIALTVMAARDECIHHSNTESVQNSYDMSSHLSKMHIDHELTDEDA